MTYVLALVVGASTLLLVDWQHSFCRGAPDAARQDRVFRPVQLNTNHLPSRVPSIWRPILASQSIATTKPEDDRVEDNTPPTTATADKSSTNAPVKVDMADWSLEKMKVCLRQVAQGRAMEACQPRADALPDTASKCKEQGNCKLMIVAHADDETIFGGKVLMEEPGWTLVCVTCNEQKRWRNFQKVAKLIGGTAIKFGLQDVHYEPWPQKDQQRFAKAIFHLFQTTSFSEIVTHNPYGEYGHPQHQQVFQWAAGFVKKVPLYVFSANSTVTVPKHQRPLLFRMLASHTDQVRALSKLLSITIHQSTRRCLLKFNASGQVYYCTNSNKEMEEEERRILRPQGVVSRFQSRSSFLRNAR